MWGSYPIALLTLIDSDSVGVKPTPYASLVCHDLLTVLVPMVPGCCISCQPPRFIDVRVRLITDVASHSLRLTYCFCTITQLEAWSI